MANLSVFSFEEREEEDEKRRKLLQQKKECAREEALFYQRLACRISKANYGADTEWDRTFGKFPIYVDIPGFGLCVTTRGRWKNYQGRRVVHWGVYRINPFVEDDYDLRSEYFEIPTDGYVDKVHRQWVFPIPFTLLQFRLNDKNRADSELVFCRAKDFEDDDSECKVMLLSDFLFQEKKDTDHTRGYRILMDALRMQFPSEVEKYMSLERRIHSNSQGPAHVQSAEYERREPDPRPITTTPSRVTDLTTVYKRIGLGIGVDTAISFETIAALCPEVDETFAKSLRCLGEAEYIKKHSIARKIRGIFECGVSLPEIPPTRKVDFAADNFIRDFQKYENFTGGNDETTDTEWTFSRWG